MTDNKHVERSGSSSSSPNVIGMVLEYHQRSVWDALHAADDSVRVRLTPVQQWSIVRDIGRVLHFLHTAARPVVHRDIKTANMLLTDTLSSIKLIDFSVPASSKPKAIGEPE
ncbi:MAG: protein kinase domain-containing protein [Rhizobium oryzihabitans]